MRAFGLFLLICLTRAQYNFNTIGVDYGANVRFTPTREKSNPIDSNIYRADPPVEDADDVFRTPPRDPAAITDEPQEHEVQAAFGTTPFSLIIADTSRSTSEAPEYFRQLVVPTFQKHFINGMFEREVQMCTLSLNQHLTQKLSKELKNNEEAAEEVWKQKAVGPPEKIFKFSPHLAKVDYMAAYIPDPQYPVVSFFLRGLSEAYVFRSFKTAKDSGVFYWPVLVNQTPKDRFTEDTSVLSTDVGSEPILKHFEKALTEGDIVLLGSRGLYQAFVMPAIIFAVNVLAKNSFQTAAEAYNRIFPIFEAVRDILRMRTKEVKTYLEGKPSSTQDDNTSLSFELEIPSDNFGCLNALKPYVVKETENNPLKKFTFKSLNDALVPYWYRKLPNCGHNLDDKQLIIQMFKMPIEDLINYNYQRVYPLNAMMNYLRGSPDEKSKGKEGNKQGLKSHKIDGVKAAEALAKAAAKFLKSEPIEHLAIGLHKIASFHPFDKISNAHRQDSNYVKGNSEQEIEKAIRRDVTVVVAQLVANQASSPVEKKDNSKANAKGKGTADPKSKESTEIKEVVMLPVTLEGDPFENLKKTQYEGNSLVLKVDQKFLPITQKQFLNLINLKALYEKIISKGKLKFQDTLDAVAKANKKVANEPQTGGNISGKLIKRNLVQQPENASQTLDNSKKLSSFMARRNEKQARVKTIFGRSLWEPAGSDKVQAVTGSEAGMSMRGFFKFDTPGAEELNSKLQKM